MLDPRLLYTLDEDVVAKLADAHPVLIQQLDGFVDAGGAGRQLTSHVLEHLEHLEPYAPAASLRMLTRIVEEGDGLEHDLRGRVVGALGSRGALEDAERRALGARERRG